MNYYVYIWTFAAGMSRIAFVATASSVEKARQIIKASRPQEALDWEDLLVRDPQICMIVDQAIFLD